MVLENMSSPPCAWIPPRLSFKGPFMASSAQHQRPCQAYIFHPRSIYYLLVRVDSSRLPSLFPQRKAFHSPSVLDDDTHFTSSSAQWTRTPLAGLVCVFIGALSLWSFFFFLFFPSWTFIMSLHSTTFPRFLITFVYLRMRWRAGEFVEAAIAVSKSAGKWIELM